MPLDPDVWVALAPTVVLMAYGNLSCALAYSWQAAARPSVLYVTHALLVVLAVAWALGPARLSMTDLGLGPEGWAWSALLVLSAGSLGTLLVVGALRRRGGGGSAPAARLPGSVVASDVGHALYVLVATAACEELWFRGLLQACWVQVLGPAGGNLVVAGLFAIWHLVFLRRMLGDLARAWPLPLALTYPLSLLLLVGAGLGLGWLRQYSHALAAPILVHWVGVLAAAYVFGPTIAPPERERRHSGRG